MERKIKLKLWGNNLSCWSIILKDLRAELFVPVSLTSMFSGNLFCSSSPGFQNGHRAFSTSCHINEGSQSPQSPRQVTPSASPYWNIPNHGVFKDPLPVKTSDREVARIYCPSATSLFQGTVLSFSLFDTILEEENPQRGPLHHDHTKNFSTCLSYLTEMLGRFRQYWLMPWKSAV